MRFIADFHIHSHYSLATSRLLVPEYLDWWAGRKGIAVVGTGDFTHPGWTAELIEKLEPAEQGLFRLRPGLRLPGAAAEAARFILTAEVSSIYKQDGRVRKVHNIIFAPDFATVARIQDKLRARGANITSDGRPIVGLAATELLELCLEASEDIMFVPAHIWTPWFSMLGAKSGFDSVRECFGPLARHIHAVETGLSTDPPMNWMCSFLDGCTLLSNSDAHSPDKLGRNANVLDCALSYAAICAAVKGGKGKGFVGTVDMFPQEGKYHYDGHRKCGVCWNPLETLEHGGRCTVCGREVTPGVMHRIARLADRDDPSGERSRRPEFFSIIPLAEIISEIVGCGPASRKVTRLYDETLAAAGTEFDVLLNSGPDALDGRVDGRIVEALRRMRARRVFISEGFDGQFGTVKVFGADGKGGQERKMINFDLGRYRRLCSV